MKHWRTSGSPLNSYQVKKLTDCELGKYRNYIGNSFDVAMQAGKSLHFLGYMMKEVVTEIKKRGIPPTGMMGMCRCDTHKLLPPPPAKEPV